MVRNRDNEESAPLRLLPVAEVAHLLHVHPNTIRQWSKDGMLKAYRIGKRRDYRFHIADIENFINLDGSSTF